MLARGPGWSTDTASTVVPTVSVDYCVQSRRQEDDHAPRLGVVDLRSRVGGGHGVRRVAGPPDESPP